jgi:hypothetical protein
MLDQQLTMHMQGALLGTPTPVTLLEVELAGRLDLLPSAPTIEGDAGLHRRLDLEMGMGVEQWRSTAAGSASTAHSHVSMVQL